MKNMITGAVILLTSLLGAREIPPKDLEVMVGKHLLFGSVDAVMVRFGGYTTPECKLAVSTDGAHFFFKKVNSTCKNLTNSKGVKIVCNTNISVCKTRQELIDIVQKSSSLQASQNAEALPSWCSASHLNKTERTICANETLSALDKKLAKAYGATKADNKDKAQKEWLQKRNQCGNDAACIEEAYEHRIKQLENSSKEESEIMKGLQEAKESLKELRAAKIKLLKTECKSWSVAASCLALGVLYDEGKWDVPEDDSLALDYYKKACDLGDAKGCAYLGLMYGNGEGVDKDLHTALRYLDKGCGKGYQKACENADTVRRNLKNRFRGVRKEACYRINEYGPQRVCLEGTGGDACYGLKDYGLQRVCREGAKTDACYALKDYGMQRVCREGIRTDACYAIKDYKIQRSCQNFKGSTTFWLILAHYGYYVN